MFPFDDVTMDVHLFDIYHIGDIYTRATAFLESDIWINFNMYTRYASTRFRITAFFVNWEQVLNLIQ